jgi:transcriptional regulator with GAF, ATPase, and Fis domain
MPGDASSTVEHRGPSQPKAGVRRPALVCAFPRPAAVPVPDSGSVIGREWLAKSGLHDSEVSSSHVKVDRAGGVLRVADAGSRNGTWVNGVRLARGDLAPLEVGSTLRLGRTIFVFRDELQGSFEPAAPVGDLVGPYGLRPIAHAIAAFATERPRNVLVQGETGTGKELVARAVAAALGRSGKLAAVNVAGVARGVFESQMFGHVAGAFSDAKTAAAGIVVAHDGGTIFLDEIGELGLELQAKLLRLLDNREVLAVGAQRPVTVDVLVIAATNRKLEEMVERGEFRRDLLARLAMAKIHLPALRDRNEDLFSIAEGLARRAGAAPLAPDQVEVEAAERLLLEPWPSNVRELDAALAAVRRVDRDPGLRLWALEEVLGEPRGGKAALTQEVVDAAIEAAGGNVTLAAKNLGVSRGKLLRLQKRARNT